MISRVRLPFLLLALLLSFARPNVYAQSGGPYEITFFTIDGGGGPAAGDVTAANGTAGQPDAGSMAGGSYVLDGGFWPGGLCRPPAPPTAANDGPVCTGGTVHLTASPTIAGASYAWTGPNGFASTQQNPVIANATAAVAGVYRVTADVEGCASLPGQTSVAFVADGTAPTVTAPTNVTITQTECN